MKILYHGDSPTVATGFGNVSRNLLAGLAKEHEIVCIGINDRGGWKDPKIYPYKIYPAIYSNYNDLLGMRRILDVINGYDPEVGKADFDVLIMQYDFTTIAEGRFEGELPFFDLLKRSVENSTIKKKILYTPFDNPLIKPHWAVALDFFDIIVVPSQYAKECLMAQFGKKWVDKKVKVIIYGVEPDLFYPMEENERRAIRRSISGSLTAQSKVEVDLTDKYIVGFVGRNQWRKDFYRLVKIFAKFKETHPKAYLYLHTQAHDTAHEGGDILELLSMHNLYFAKDYLVPLGLLPEIGIKRETMNEIYNMMDVYLSCSLGEGLGLPYLEAMLAGTPVIAPNNTTVPELLDFEANFDPKAQVEKGRGVVYKNSNTVSFGWFDWNRERELGDINDALEKLNYVYKNPEAVEKMVGKARIYASKITPQQMVEKFKEILR